MLTAQWVPYRLDFRFEAITSRDRMRHKDTYFVRIFDTDEPERYGVGECALFRGLSADDMPDYENMLAEACSSPENSAAAHPYASIRFGFETALSDFRGGASRVLFPSAWSKGYTGIPINGLIWMGDKALMSRRIAEKLDQGFRVLKLKIGGINFDDELELLAHVRKHFSEADLEIRLDANGSLTPENVFRRLSDLARYAVHSIEQPVKPGQIELMENICRRSPVRIALDEELIGLKAKLEKEELLSYIHPHYIILKPALVGGVAQCDQYIELAEKTGIGWWATSALESNIGLNAIAQWLSTKPIGLPQGLGTGQLYHNNIDSPVVMQGSELRYIPESAWQNLDDLPWRI